MTADSLLFSMMSLGLDQPNEKQEGDDDDNGLRQDHHDYRCGRDKGVHPRRDVSQFRVRQPDCGKY